MKAFTFDGHDYVDHGDRITDIDGTLVVTVGMDYPANEYWIAEREDDLTGLAVQRVHVNHPNARQAAIECAIAGIM